EEGEEGGLDELVSRSLDVEGKEGPNLADLAACPTAPSLLGTPQALPVMVNRSVSDPSSVMLGTKPPSAFDAIDALANSDLAISQEEWNDFVDETTAPEITTPDCPPLPQSWVPPLVELPPRFSLGEGAGSAEVAG
ncbi:unnamed protein product, partial [Discosporangium mesarthrocarpum]